MNKLLKGAIAGAAGVALLLGGAGTFALWNDTASVDAGSVASGTLTIAGTGSPSWMNIASDVAPLDRSIASIAGYRIVPGDKLELTQDFKINATGDRLVATLSYDPSTIKAGTASENLALESALVFGLDATSTDGNVKRIGTGNTFTITPTASESTVTVKLTVQLPSSVSGLVAQGGTVDLSALGFKLVQDTRP